MGKHTILNIQIRSPGNIETWTKEYRGTNAGTQQSSWLSCNGVGNSKKGKKDRRGSMYKGGEKDKFQKTSGLVF